MFINVKKDYESGDTYLDLPELLKDTTVRVSDVKSYTVVISKNALKIRLYDEDGGIIIIQTKDDRIKNLEDMLKEVYDFIDIENEGASFEQSEIYFKIQHLLDRSFYERIISR